MRLNLEKRNLTLTDYNNDRIHISNDTSLPYSALVHNLGYRSYNVEGKRLVIPEKDLSENYEPIDDFYFLEFSKKYRKMISYYQYHKSKKHDYIIMVDKDLNEYHETEEENYKEGLYKIYNVYYRSDLPEESDKAVEEINKFCYVDNNSSSKIDIVVKTTNGFRFKQYSIKPLEVNIDTMYNDDFKPVHESVVKKLSDTTKGVVMLHGKAGTGKTNYIKHLTTLIPDKRFVFISSNLIPSLTDPSFISNLIDNKGSILVLEDCENYLKDRDTNGDNNVVSTILNLSDGMLSDVLGIQIICTFNTNLNKIDKALLRKGRLIAEYNFEELSVVKTNNLLSSLGCSDVVNDPTLHVDKKMTLTDIFNYKDDVYRVIKETKKIGF